MNEPLKGKLYSFNELGEWIETSQEDYDKHAKLKVLCRIEDIKSAVEWFKEKIRSSDDDVGQFDDDANFWIYNETKLLELINKAFQDVIKKE